MPSVYETWGEVSIVRTEASNNNDNKKTNDLRSARLTRDRSRVAGYRSYPFEILPCRQPYPFLPNPRRAFSCYEPSDGILVSPSFKSYRYDLK